MPETVNPTANRRTRVTTKAHPVAIRMQALALLASGRTRGYVAKALNLSPHTVTGWQYRYKTTDFSRTQRKIDTLNVQQTVARALADDGKATREKLAATVKRSAETLAEAKLGTVREVAEVAPVVQSLVSSAKVLHEWDKDRADGILALGSYLETVDSDDLQCDAMSGEFVDLEPATISARETEGSAEGAGNTQGALYSISPASTGRTENPEAKPLSPPTQANTEAGEGASALHDVGL